MDVIRILNDYCDDVLSGRRTTGHIERCAVERFRRDMTRADKPDCPFYFDARIAERVITFIQLLKHSTGKFKGKPFILESWQVFIVANIFGWIVKATGKRRIRKFHVEIGRKNGKTALVAAICLYCMLFDGEGRPEIYVAATERSQSKLCWEEATRFVCNSSWLSERLRIVPSKYVMFGPDAGVFLALGGDGAGTDGKNPSCSIADEIHEFRTAAHFDLWGKMRTGSGTRTQPIYGAITTAGSTRSVLWKTERKYAEAVASGEQFDDAYFAFICCLDKDDDIFDEENWPKANPGLHTIKDPTDMRDMATQARIDVSAERLLKRYHCNLMVEPTAQGISAAVWSKGNKPLPDLSGRICYGAIDLGWLDDLAAFWLVFPPPNLTTGTYYTLGWAFCPQHGARDLATGDWQKWISEGLLIATDGNQTDIEAIRSCVKAAKAKYKIKAIALDENNARQFGQELTREGYDVVGHGQKGIHYNEPLRSLKAACNEGRVIHGGSPLLAWAVENMVVAISAGLMRPAKEHSRDKIDPAVAMIMGWSIATLGTGQKDKGDARVRYA